MICYHDQALSLVGERWIVGGSVCRGGLRVETIALLGSMVVKFVCTQTTLLHEVAECEESHEKCVDYDLEEARCMREARIVVVQRGSLELQCIIDSW